MNQEKRELILIKTFIKGDSKSFDKLFRLYYNKVFAYMMSLTGNREDAEEIVQESFMKIWNKRKDYNEKYPFGSLLFKVAKNTFLNFNRRKVNNKNHEECLYSLDDVSHGNTDDNIILKETSEIIYARINNLPPKRKEIFILKKLDGLSRSEIANKLGISVTTVDSQLQKASKYLKNELIDVNC